jgi:hypothetical protein
VNEFVCIYCGEEADTRKTYDELVLEGWGTSGEYGETCPNCDGRGESIPHETNGLYALACLVGVKKDGE